MSKGRTYVVNQRHQRASDKGPGTESRPFKTINRAAELAGPGDTVLVRAGVYRERVNPRRGGLEGKPIVYMGAPGEQVFIRGSEEFRPAWKSLKGRKDVFVGSLKAVSFGRNAYAGQVEAPYLDFNPYLLNFNRHRVARPHGEVLAELRRNLEAAKDQLKEIEEGADLAFSKAQRRKADIEAEILLRSRKKNAKYVTTLGQVFVAGKPLVEVETMEELFEIPSTWMASPEGDALLVHFPPDDVRPSRRLVEISVRHAVFSPLERRLGHITVRGFVLEHAANHWPTWGKHGWPQAGLLSCRAGHHWVVEGNVVRYAKGLGIDCGSEGGSVNLENAGPEADRKVEDRARLAEDRSVGHHLFRDNCICDNGHCGIAGIRHYGTRVIGNVIERNNRTGYPSPWWEFAGIKFHFFFDGLIEGNLIRDNDAHGIWIDNQWRGSRITRNVIVNNLWSGINVELGRGPVLIDSNVIACTRQGDGVYGHDVADVTIAHNLIYANANFGVWFAYATPRVKPQDGCWDIKTFNNIIMGNKAGAIAYPMPWQCAGNNVSDGNLFMGGGDNLDEGGGPRPPLFQLTNSAHMGPMGQHHPPGFEAQTPERVREKFVQALRKAGVPEDKWPNLDRWSEQHMVPLDLWQAVMGNDADSLVMRVIRDSLASRVVAWDCKLDETIRRVRCRPVAGVDRDFRGRKMPARNPLPGPFQEVEIGQNRIILWPVRGVRTTRILS